MVEVNDKRNNLLDMPFIVESKGLNIWIKEKNYYSRCGKADVSFSLAFRDDKNSDSSYSRGKVLVIDIKDFKQYFEGTFFKRDGRNEISLYIKGKNAIEIAKYILEHEEELC